MARKPQFVNINGVRIRKGKTTAQLAEQHNRIGDELKRRAEAERGVIHSAKEYDDYISRLRKITKVGQAMYDSGEYALDAQSGGVIPGMRFQRDGKPRIGVPVQNTYLKPYNPNAVYGAKGNSNG